MVDIKERNPISEDSFSKGLMWSCKNPLDYLFDYVNYESNTVENPKEVKVLDYLDFIEHPILNQESLHRGYLYGSERWELLRRGSLHYVDVEAYGVYWRVVL